MPLPFHCSPWQMQCGRCHHADHILASYVPPLQPQPCLSGFLKKKIWTTYQFTHFYPNRNDDEESEKQPHTDTNLYVVAIGGIFKMIDGAHHVQSHVTNVMSVIFCLLWSSSHHHVGISNGFNLQRASQQNFLIQRNRYCIWVEVHTINTHTHTPWRHGASHWVCQTVCTWCWAWTPPALEWCGCRCEWSPPHHWREWSHLGIPVGGEGGRDWGVGETRLRGQEDILGPVWSVFWLWWTTIDCS